MTATERVQLMREIKVETKRRRREAHARTALHILAILLPFIIFALLFLIGFDDAEAFAESAKNPVVNVHGGDKHFAMFSEEEEWILLHIGMAEAGNQSPEGIALVMNVICNRCNDGRFGTDMMDVVTRPHQFSTVQSGSWLGEPNEDCYTALEMVENGWDESQGALYFRATWSGHFTWANYLFTYGGHNFYN